MVLDIHHCWIHEDRYIEPDDPRIERILQSWRGVRPTMHYSQPQESLMELGFAPEQKLEIPVLLEQVSKRDLYAHSKRMWNRWTNRYAFQFLDRFDIMLEARTRTSPPSTSITSTSAKALDEVSPRHRCDGPRAAVSAPLGYAFRQACQRRSERD